MKTIKEGSLSNNFKPIHVTCPRCGAEFEIEYCDLYESLVVNGEVIHRYSCPTDFCPQKFDVDPDEWNPPEIIRIHNDNNNNNNNNNNK